MSIQTSPFLIAFAFNIVLAAGLGYYAYRRLQAEPGNRPVRGFLWITVFSAVWTLSRTIQYVVTSETITIALFAGIYVGYGGVTVAFFYFAMAFVGREEWLTRRRIAALAAVPVFAWVAAVTNPIHGLFWSGEFQFIGDLYIYQREFEAGFLVYLAYTQAVLYYSVYRLVRFAVGSKEIYRLQAAAIVVGSLLPMVLGVLYTLEATPVVPDFVDLTPVGFATAGLFYAYAIFRHQLLDLVPVARDTVVESMRDGYVVVDTDGRVVDLNDAAAAVAARDDALGERAGEVFPECTALLAEHEHGTQTETEFTVEDAGGQRFLIATVSSLRKDDRLIGRLLFIRDVTDRRSVQKRYQALIENSSDLIFVMEPDGTLTYASPSLRNVTGADPQRVQGEDAFAFIHPDDRERVREAFDAVQTEPGRQKRVEYRIVTADDEWINVEAELSNLLENPYVEGIVSNARDITARKERERELKELNERLVAANERLERFASVVSHDLRNPINVARGHLEMAREAGKEENFEKVEESLERMEKIIDDVLTLARQGESVGETDAVGLGAVARDAWETVETGEARLEVVDDADFEADPDRLRQLLENVFRNAVEHGSTGSQAEPDDAVEHGSTSPDSQARQDAGSEASEPSVADAPEDAVEHSSTSPDSQARQDAGSEASEPSVADAPEDAGPDVTVRVGWSGDGFYVADDGPGIPEDRREEVFEAGTTTNSDGTGLGLSIVEEIATAHGWEVTATESAEGGARFEFRGVATLEAAD